MRSQHPGQTLLHQYLQPNQLSQNRLARAIGVPPRRINEIVLGKRSITADTAVRLAHYFGSSAGYWMQIQAEYDIERASEKIGSQLERLEKPRIQPSETRLPVASTPEQTDNDHQRIHATRRTGRRRIMR